MATLLRIRFSALFSVLAAGILLSACPAGVGPGAVKGGSSPAGDLPDAAVAANEDSPISNKTADDTASNPGPGPSMPSGTLAPLPDVPVNFNFIAEGTYCRFEGDESRLLIRGSLFKTVEDKDPAECADACQGMTLRLFYPGRASDSFQEMKLEDAPHFQFEVEDVDPASFGLILITQSKGFFVKREFQPYAVDGVPAFCPSVIPAKAKMKTFPLAPL